MTKSEGILTGLMLIAVVAIGGSSSDAMAHGGDNDSWKLDSIVFEKTYVGLNPAHKIETLPAETRTFKLGWVQAGKEISAQVNFSEVPAFIRASEGYRFAATINTDTSPFVASQPDTIFTWGFWFGSSPEKNRIVGGKIPGKLELNVEDSRDARNAAASFGGPSDPRDHPGDFWETLHVSIALAGTGITGDMLVQMHYKWTGPPLPEPACNMGTVWSGGALSKWVRRGSSNVFEVVNGNEYTTGNNPGRPNAEVTLTFTDNSFIGHGHTVGGFAEQECNYQGFVSGKEVRLRAVMCTGYSKPIEGGLYIECDAKSGGAGGGGNTPGDAVTGVLDPVVPDRTSQPTQNPGARIGAIINNVLTLNGKWSGSYTNSKGEGGTSTINLVEGANGVLTGDEGGWKIENGRRNGNVLTWEYRNQNNGCRDYQVRMEVSGNVLTGAYEVRDRCASPSTYGGNYIQYKRE